MPLPRTRADALAVFLSGAGGDGGSQADPALSLGHYRSSSRADSLGVLIEQPIANVRIDYAAPGNSPGVGHLTAYDENSLAWAAPGEDPGDPVVILNGEQRLLEAAGQPGKFLLVTRTSAADFPQQVAAVTLTRTFNDVFGQSNIADINATGAGGPTYRMVVCKAGAASIKSFKIWIGPSDPRIRIAREDPSAQPGGFFQTIASATTPPTAVTFVAPNAADHPDVITLDLRPNEQVGIWIERWVPSA